LLMNNKGILKICDFGLAREYGDPLQPYTQPVVTQWYRPPELFLGVQEYSTAVDMWSVGCIFGELVTGKPILTGKTEMAQLDQVNACGALLLSLSLSRTTACILLSCASSHSLSLIE
jgi:cell division cycle 2-like